jgi:hypothetical protein
MAEAMAVVGIGASLAGGITSAMGAKQMGQVQLQMNNYQAGVAMLNAKIAKENADYSLAKGEKDAAKYGMAAAQRMGSIKAAQGASGFDVNTGTAVNVRDSQKQVTDIDMNQIRANAARTAYDYNVQSIQNENQAQLYRMAGANAVQAANINATASLINTASSVSSKWLQGNQVGMWGGGSGGYGYTAGSSATP